LRLESCKFSRQSGFCRLPYITAKVASTYRFCYNLRVSERQEDIIPIRIGVPIRVLLADDTNIMREAVRKLLEEESRIQIVGEASTFAAAMQMIADFRPDVLLLDLHMPQKRELLPALVKSQLACVEYTLAISFANDEEAKSLAASYGAVALLDKMSLYSQLLPAIMRLAEPPPNQSFKLELQPGTEGLSLDPSE
jgi:CheY-like chemotaxis protein